jgi:hypothetical protein
MTGICCHSSGPIVAVGNAISVFLGISVEATVLGGVVDDRKVAWGVSVEVTVLGGSVGNNPCIFVSHPEIIEPITKQIVPISQHRLLEGFL